MTAGARLRSRDQRGAPERLAVEAARGEPRITVLLSRDGHETARMLNAIRHPPSAEIASDPPHGMARVLRPHGGGAGPAESTAPPPYGTPLVLCAGDIDALRPTSRWAAKLGGSGRAEEAAGRTIAALRAEAAALLADGRGPIARDSARLQAIDASLTAACEHEELERAHIDKVLAAAAPLAELERRRERLTRERDDWQALLQVWPQWCQLRDAEHALEGLAAGANLPEDLEARAALTAAQLAEAEDGLRNARHRVGELQRAIDDWHLQPPPATAPLAPDVMRLVERLPAYRAELLTLAATRARLADLERTIAAGVQRHGREADAIGLAALLTSECRAALQRWQEQLRAARAARAAAAQALASVSERIRGASNAVGEELSRDGAADDGDIDSRWRMLWRLRQHLDEIWDVQSRAESQARALREREPALRELEAARTRGTWSTLQRVVQAVLVVAATVAIAAALNRSPHALPLAALVAALAALGLTLQARARSVRARQEQRSRAIDELRAETDRLRQRCAADWAHAARLTAAIDQAAARLALRDAPSPEALDAYEQGLAAEMRSAGAHASLSARLVDLLDAQDAEPECAAALTAAETDLARLERRWEAWRGEMGLPDAVDVEQAEAWGEDVVQFAAACTARDDARTQLLALEPGIAAWEDETRGVLRRAGTGVSRELCGSALAAALTALAARVREDEQERRRGVRLEAELRAAEQQLGAATAERERASAARAELIATVAARGETDLDAAVGVQRRWREARALRDRLQRSVESALSAAGAGAAARQALVAGAVDAWTTALHESQTALDQTASRMEAMADCRRAAQHALEKARTASALPDLRLEREQLLTELAGAARAWKLRTLAAALLESAVRERSHAESRELLERASILLARLTGGRFIAIVAPAGREELGLTERGGRTVPVDATLERTLRVQALVSLLLGRAAQLAGRGEPAPVVFDEVLAALSPDDARLAGQEIAAIARTCPVVYFTSAAGREGVLAAMPGEVSVFDASGDLGELRLSQ